MTIARSGRRTLRSRLTLVAMTAGIACAAASPAPSSAAAGPPPAQIAPALLAKITLLGHPTARLTVGTQVQVRGIVMNADSTRHDAFLAATLYDGRGRVVGRAMGNAEDLRPGRAVGYALIGSVIAPRWTTIHVKVTRVTENVAGAGTD